MQEVFELHIMMLSNQVRIIKLDECAERRVKELYIKLDGLIILPNSTDVRNVYGVTVATLLTPMPMLTEWLFEVDRVEQEWCDD